MPYYRRTQRKRKPAFINAPTKPRIWWEPSSAKWAVRVPIHGENYQQFIMELSLNAGEIAPKYIKETNIWLIPDDDIATIQHLVFQFFGDYDFTDRPKGSGAASVLAEANGTNPYKVLLAAASESEANKLYRAIIARIHPDLPSGNAELCQAVNVAWQEIKKALYES